MTLLDLPRELFYRVIQLLEYSMCKEETTKYRQVCHAFNESFLDCLTESASKNDFGDLILSSAGSSEFFWYHGGAILSKKVLRNTDPRVQMLNFARVVVDHLLKQQSLPDLQSEQRRFQYTRGVCNALMALRKRDLMLYLKYEQSTIDMHAMRGDKLYRIMPAVSAAIGDTELLLRHTSSYSDLCSSNCVVFPTALEAAVASGHTDILSCMLSYLKTSVKGKPDARPLFEVSYTADAIGDALLVAIRLHKTDAGNMIFEFLAENPLFSRSMREELGERLIQDCMVYGHGALINGALAYDSHQSHHRTGKGRLGKLSLDKSEELFLLNRGHPSALRHLIRSGQFDPNKWAQVCSPLEHVLDERKYGLARVLLENGADIDARPKELGGKTILWHTAKGGYYMRVKLLLEYGAQPDHQNPDLSPLYAVRSSGYRKKCRFLLKKAKEHGKDYISRPDIWNIYGRELNEDREDLERGLLGN